MKETTPTQNPTPAAAMPWAPTLIDLYSSRFEQLVNVAQRVVCDRSLAEECVQETFMNYHLKGVAPREGAEYSYLRSMVRNLAISMVRSEQRGREIVAQLPEPTAGPSPETLVLANLAAQDLAQQVALLAPRQSQVVGLRLVGLSVAESARRMRVSDGTVKTHRHRAAGALHPYFDQAIAA